MIGMALVVARTREPYYGTLQFEPEWLWTQIQNAFSAVTWKGWLYSLKSMLDWSPIGSLVFYFVALILLLAGLLWLDRSSDEHAPDRRHGVLVILNMPSGPFDIRIYYPFTQLARHYHENPTLRVLP